MTVRSLVATFAALLVGLGCAEKRDSSVASSTPPAAPPSAQPVPAPEVAISASRHYGEAIQGKQTVTLASVASNPASFKGKTIVTEGTVSAVCQEQGCWMTIANDDRTANVRFHGHSFFVPRDSKGKRAKIEGTIQLIKDGKECDEMGATGAQLQFDATGVDLM